MVIACSKCGHIAGILTFQDSRWICYSCYEKPEESTCRLHEYGHENPEDPKGSTAHVRDIKARRIDPKTKEQFYYQASKTYFL